MKRIALVNQRYGLEVNGGSEYYTRMIAERLANRYEVEVLTTKAVDYTTWKDWYARDVETIHGVTVRRFPVEKLRARDFNSYNEQYLQEAAAGQRSGAKERIWFESRGRIRRPASSTSGSTRMTMMCLFSSPISTI